MSCTIAVYEKLDGIVRVANMNSCLMGRMFGGTVSDVMAGSVTDAQQEFLESVR